MIAESVMGLGLC